MTRIVTVTLGLAAVLAMTAGRAEACTCVVESGACGAASDYWRASAVFLARVDAIERHAGKGVPRYMRARRVRLRVLEAFRGAPAQGAEVVVVTGSGGGDCGYPFTEGEDYLVYATRPDEGAELSTNICTRTKAAAQASADLEYARAAAAGRAPSGRVTGEVRVQTRDLARGRQRTRPAPLAGATVLLTQNGGAPLRAETDTRGRYSIEGLAAGRYLLDATLPDGYYALQAGRTIDLADTRACVEANLTVLHDGRVRGRMIDGAGRGVPGLTVELTVPARIDEPFGAERLRTVTGSDGTFELARVPPGKFVLGINTQRDKEGVPPQPRVFYPGVEEIAQARIVAVPAGGRVALDDFVLPGHVEYLRVEGTVLASDGVPAAGARVFLKGDSETSYILSEPAITDASGRFVIAALSGQTCRLFAERAVTGDGVSSMEASDPIALTPDADSPPVRIQLRRRH